MKKQAFPHPNCLNLVVAIVLVFIAFLHPQNDFSAVMCIAAIPMVFIFCGKRIKRKKREKELLQAKTEL